MIQEATFGAGCFWCVEACFSELKGVSLVLPGYAGGTKETANYKDVCSGKTDHVEVANVTFDDEQISYSKLLEIFWFVHDPTQVNRQGNDIGPQYRSAIYYHNNDQKEEALSFKTKLNIEKVWDSPVVTEINQIDQFYPAEDYHRNYLQNNPENPYCQSVVRPKVDKFKQVFSQLLND